MHNFFVIFSTRQTKKNIVKYRNQEKGDTKDMRDELLTISELARLRKMTSETLRHYDRIGLIKPDYIEPRSGYRYYSIRQYEKLGTVKELRALGMSLSDIQDYFNNRNLQKSKEILTEYQQNLEKDLQKKIALNQVMKRKLKFLNNLDTLPPVNTVFEQDHDERYIITFGEAVEGQKEYAYAFTQLEGYLDETAPIIASDRIGVYTDSSLLDKHEDVVPAVPMVFVNDDHFDSEYLKIIPAGKYLCLYYPEGRLEQYHPSFELMKEYMREHDLTVCGKILQVYKVDVTVTSNRDETILEIQVPVRQKVKSYI